MEVGKRTFRLKRCFIMAFYIWNNVHGYTIQLSWLLVYHHEKRMLLVQRPKLSIPHLPPQYLLISRHIAILFVCPVVLFFASLPLYVFWQRRPDFDNFTVVAWDAERVWRLICKNVGLWPWSSIAKNADKKPFHNRNLLLKPLTKPSEVLCAEFQVCFAPLST